MTTRILLESKSSNDPEWQYQANRFLRNCFCPDSSKSFAQIRKNIKKNHLYIKSLVWWFQFFFGSSCQPNERTRPGLKRFPSHPWAPHDARPSGRRVSSWTEVLWANHGGRWGAFSEVWKTSRFSPFEGLMITYPFFWIRIVFVGFVACFSSFLFFSERNVFFCMLDIPDSVGSTWCCQESIWKSAVFTLNNMIFGPFSRSHLRWFDPFSRNTFQPPHSFTITGTSWPCPDLPRRRASKKWGHPRVGKEGSWDNTLTFWMVDAFLFLTFWSNLGESCQWNIKMKELLERFAGSKRWNWELEDGGVFGEIIVYHLRLLSPKL